MLSTLKSLPARIQTILAWLPILWRDRDWDYAFLLRIIEFKISRMRRHHLKHSHAGKREIHRITHHMRTCELLLKRLQNDEYLEAEDYPRANRTIEDLIRPWSDDEIKIAKYAIKRAELRRRHEEELLFRILRRHYKTWWD